MKENAPNNSGPSDMDDYDDEEEGGHPATVPGRVRDDSGRFCPHQATEAIEEWVKFFQRKIDEGDKSWTIEKVLQLSKIDRTTFFRYREKARPKSAKLLV